MNRGWAATRQRQDGRGRPAREEAPADEVRDGAEREREQQRDHENQLGDGEDQQDDRREDQHDRHDQGGDALSPCLDPIGKQKPDAHKPHREQRNDIDERQIADGEPDRRLDLAVAGHVEADLAQAADQVGR
jgi:hypothetical protein